MRRQDIRNDLRKNLWVLVAPKFGYINGLILGEVAVRKKVLVVGFGRMGLSHAVIISGILGAKNVEFHVCDPSFFSRRMAVGLLREVAFVTLDQLRRDKGLVASYNFILLTAPPFLRAEFLTLLEGFKGRVFVEKPVFVELGENQMSGYVNQHAVLNSVLRERLASETLRKVTARLITNASFEKIKSGWRSTPYGSVLHEFGGHVLSLVGALLPAEKIFRKRIEDLALQVSTHSRDVAKFSFVDGDVTYSIELVANSSEVRKATYDVVVETCHDKIYYDLYSISSETGRFDTVSLPETGVSVSFYLRGFDFTRQMEAFLVGDMDVLSSSQISALEKILLVVEGEK